MKKNVLLYGKCQVGNIAQILNKMYNDKLNIFCLTLLHEIEDLNYFNHIKPKIIESDIIIWQNVFIPEKDPFKKILPFIGKDTKIIFIESLYNFMYHPELIILDYDSLDIQCLSKAFLKRKKF